MPKPTDHLSLAALALVVGAVACVPDAPTGPTSPLAGATSIRKRAPVAKGLTPGFTLGSIESVINVQLRAIPGPPPILPPNPIFGYGHLQLQINAQPGDACLPPNPISPQPGMTTVSLCGRIFNEGGALYRGGGLYFVSGLGEGPPSLVASFTGAVPNDPCRRYDIVGAVLVTDALATDMIGHPESYQVRMDGQVSSDATSIGGSLDGSAWGPVGSRPETDPYFAAKVCSVAITP